MNKIFRRFSWIVQMQPCFVSQSVSDLFYQNKIWFLLIVNYHYVGFPIVWVYWDRHSPLILRAVVDCLHSIVHSRHYELVNATVLWFVAPIFYYIHIRRSTFVAWVSQQKMAIAVYLTKKPLVTYDLNRFVHYFYKKREMQSAFMEKSFTQTLIAMGVSVAYYFIFDI